MSNTVIGPVLVHAATVTSISSFNTWIIFGINFTLQFLPHQKLLILIAVRIICKYSNLKFIHSPYKYLATQPRHEKTLLWHVRSTKLLQSCNLLFTSGFLP